MSDAPQALVFEIMEIIPASGVNAHFEFAHGGAYIVPVVLWARRRIQDPNDRDGYFVDVEGMVIDPENAYKGGGLVFVDSTPELVEAFRGYKNSFKGG